MINVEVSKTGSENPLSTIRKFTRRVQGTGLVKTVRAKRYFSRSESQASKKRGALKRIERRNEIKQKIKEGKMAAPEMRRQAPQSRENNSSSNRLGEGAPIAR
jgi:ribosomal protein S21